MLAKKYRLPIGLMVGKRGPSAKSRYFLLKIFPSILNFNRFGVIINKKAAKKASDRNKLKRTVFRFFEKLLFSNKQKQDFLFIALPGGADAEKKEIIADLEKLTHNLFNK